MPTAAVWFDAATGREKSASGSTHLTRNEDSGSPIRSSSPSRTRRRESPTSNSANLMLDEPPLIVRMRALAGFIADPFDWVQSQRCQFRARGPVIRVKDAANPQTLR